jgi:3-demethoxyubiquinol 3-hydroxylase
MRQTGLLDEILGLTGQAMATLGGQTVAARPTPRPIAEPADGRPMEELSSADQALAGALMRVNHVGEVCAQALYQGQAMTTSSRQTREALLQAAAEERDHLAWTETRLAELKARPSLLNPLWFSGALAMGLVAGRLGDARGLGFVVETERQVEAHLASHLERLPQGDHRSRAIVAAMQADEQAHAEQALAAGALPLQEPIPGLMRFAARVMTQVAHRI